MQSNSSIGVTRGAVPRDGNIERAGPPSEGASRVFSGSDRPVKDRLRRLFLIDYAALLCILGMTVTGLVIWLFTEKGVAGEKYFLGWHRHTWGNLHLVFSLAFLVLIVTHLVQHWRWIRSVTPKQVGPRAGNRKRISILLTTIFTLGVVFLVFYSLGDALAPTRGALSGSRNRNESVLRPRSGESRTQDRSFRDETDHESTETPASQPQLRRARGHSRGMVAVD